LYPRFNELLDGRLSKQLRVVHETLEKAAQKGGLVVSAHEHACGNGFGELFLLILFELLLQLRY